MVEIAAILGVMKAFNDVCGEVKTTATFAAGGAGAGWRASRKAWYFFSGGPEELPALSTSVRQNAKTFLHLSGKLSALAGALEREVGAIDAEVQKPSAEPEKKSAWRVWAYSGEKKLFESSKAQIAVTAAHAVPVLEAKERAYLQFLELLGLLLEGVSLELPKASNFEIAEKFQLLHLLVFTLQLDGAADHVARLHATALCRSIVMTFNGLHKPWAAAKLAVFSLDPKQHNGHLAARRKGLAYGWLKPSDTIKIFDSTSDPEAQADDTKISAPLTAGMDVCIQNSKGQLLTQSSWTKISGPHFSKRRQAKDSHQEFTISRPALNGALPAAFDFLPFVCGDAVVFHHKVKGEMYPLCVKSNGDLDLEMSGETTRACVFCVAERDLLRLNEEEADAPRSSEERAR